MRILVCASEAPLPPRNGLRLQLIELTGAMAQRHEICVVAFRWPEQTGVPPPGVELIEVALPRGGWRRPAGWAQAIMRREPVEVTRLTKPMSEAVREVLATRTFDVAHVSLGGLAGIAPALDDLPAIIAPLDAWPVNVEAQTRAAHGPRRSALGLQLRLVRRYVARAYRPYRRVVLVTDEDAAAAGRADPTIATAVVPNGVDLEHFSPDEATREAGLIVFTGALSAPSNIAAAERLVRRVLPLVRAKRPLARVALVGREPAPAVRALGELPGVQVVGEVPDLRPWLQRADAYVCAMETGTGIKNKLLEALACGAPSVATPLACHGMAVRDGVELLIADDDLGLARGVLRLLDDAELRRKLAAGSRKYIVGHHQWDHAARRFEAIYTAAVSVGPAEGEDRSSDPTQTPAAL